MAAGVSEAKRRKLPLTVVVLDPVPEPPEAVLEVVEAARPELPDIEIRIRDAAHQPTQSILAHADRVAASLIVMGARRRTGTQSFTVGATTRQVLLDASVPVLVVKDRYF